MARYNDPTAKLGTIEGDTPEAARRRRERARKEEVVKRAKWLLEEDPDVNDMVTARRVARQQIQEVEEHQAQVSKGLIDPDTGEMTSEGKKRLRSKDPQPKSQGGRRAPSTRRAAPSRPARGTRRFVRKTARTVVAPFGNAASAGWTFFQAGLSLILLYVVLRDARAIGDLARGIAAGIRRLGDPSIPLIPSAEEIAKPVNRKVVLTGPPSRVRARNYRGTNYVRGGRSGA